MGGKVGWEGRLDQREGWMVEREGWLGGKVGLEGRWVGREGWLGGKVGSEEGRLRWMKIVVECNIGL